MSTLQPEILKIADIRRQPELQCRVRTDKRTVEEYAEAMKAGVVFEPIVVFRDADGVTRMGDGHHRAAAAELAGIAELSAIVREGGEAEALLHAAGANAAHGRPRSTEDKRRAVLALHARPEWSKRGARWIAEQCKVSPTFASETLKTVHGGQLPPTEGKDGKVRKPKAPKRKPAGIAPAPVEPQVDWAANVAAHGRVVVEVTALFKELLAEHFSASTGATSVMREILRIVPQIAHKHEKERLERRRAAPEKPKRRRIVQPTGVEPAAANGGE